MTKESIDEETMEQLTKLGDILQAVHDQEKSEMTRITEEKHRLSDCLDLMSTQISTIHTSIATDTTGPTDTSTTDNNSTALESMLGAIQLGHTRAEQLESKIGLLQKKIEKESAEDANSTKEMQSACQALNDHRVQLAEKSHQIDFYAQALRSITKRIEGADESQEKLSNAFKIAEQLRKRLLECEEALESTCQQQQSRSTGEVEIEIVKEEEAANEYNLSETLESQEAHIRELEAKLFAKDREVAATQQQLQSLELAIDANKERARKLELELKEMSDPQWQMNKLLHRREVCLKFQQGSPLQNFDLNRSRLRISPL